MSTSFTVEPNRSRQLLGLLLVVHAGGLGCLVPLALPVVVKLLLGAVAMASFIHQARLHAWRLADNTIARLELDARGDATVIMRSGRVYRRVATCDAFVHPRLIIVRFEKPAVNLVLLSDMVDSEQLRRLRIWLRSIDEPPRR